MEFAASSHDIAMGARRNAFFPHPQQQYEHGQSILHNMTQA
jgi:hypothetical protein